MAGNLEVVENELIPLQQLDDPFKGMAQKFYELLGPFQLLTDPRVYVHDHGEPAQPAPRRRRRIVRPLDPGLAL